MQIKIEYSKVICIALSTFLDILIRLSTQPGVVSKMNRDTLYFALALLASFYLVEFFVMPKTIKDASSEKEPHSIALNSLPYKECFYSKSSKETAGYAVPIDDHTFAVISEKNLDNRTLYTENNETLFHVTGENTCMYSSDKINNKFSSTSNKEFSTYQLLYLQDGQLKAFECNRIDGELSLKKDLKNSAIVFVKRGISYEAKGIYDPTKGVITPFEEIEGWEKFVYPQDKSEEKFYTLENENNSITFSSKGGAVTEINLKFNEIIKPAQLDQELEREYPNNMVFPSKTSYSYKDNKFKQTTANYYPLLRRDLFTKDGDLLSSTKPKYYAFNIIGGGIENRNYTLKSISKNSITFELQLPHKTIEKKFTLTDNYGINLDINVTGVNKDLFLSSGLIEAETLSSPSDGLKYGLDDGTVNSINLGNNNLMEDGYTKPNWVSVSNGLFGIIINQAKDSNTGFASQKIPSIEALPRNYLSDNKTKSESYMVSLPIKKGKNSFSIFAGPYHDETLAEFAKENNTGSYDGIKDTNSWHSFISVPVSAFLLFLLKTSYDITGSWGISIILVSILLKIMFYPLKASVIKNQKKQKAMAPELERIRERYKKDKRKELEEIAKLNRKYGIGSSFLLTLLMIIVPLVFVINLSSTLRCALELRGQAFIPGWIDNLAAPDVFISWSTKLPWIGNSLPLLPILVGISYYIHMSLSSASMPVGGGKMTAFIFPILFLHFPAGANMFWLTNSLMDILQVFIMNKTSKDAVVE